ELGGEAVEEAQHVVEDEHLAARAWTGTDPDRGNGEVLGDVGGEAIRNALEDEREAARVLKSQRVIEERARGGRCATLDAPTAEGVHALRCQADVALHGDAGAHDGLHGLDEWTAALELDGIHA